MQKTYYDEALESEPVERDRRGRRIPRRTYYWICAIEGDTGTPLVDGPYDAESDADQAASTSTRVSSEPYEVIAMNTRDKNRATQIFRHERVSRFGRLSEALKRTRHRI